MFSPTKETLQRSRSPKERVAEFGRYLLAAILHVEYPKYDSKNVKNATTPAQRRDVLRRGYKAKTLFEDSFTCVRIGEEGSQK